MNAALPPPAGFRLRLADHPLTAIVYMGLASLCFAFMSGFSAALSREGVPWAVTGWVRTLVAIGSVLILARVQGRPIRLSQHPLAWVRSIAGATSSLCTFYAFASMPFAEATALLNATPLWTLVMARLFLDESPGTHVPLALGLGGIGVLFIVHPTGASLSWVAIVALAGGITAAIAMLALRRLAHEPTESVVLHFMGVALLAFTLWLGVVDRQGFAYRWNLRTASYVAVVGISGVVAQVLLTRAYAMDRAARIGVAGWAQIALAVPVDLIWFRASIPAATWTGLACMLLGAIFLIRGARTDAAAPSAG